MIKAGVAVIIHVLIKEVVIIEQDLEHLLKILLPIDVLSRITSLHFNVNVELVRVEKV